MVGLIILGIYFLFLIILEINPNSLVRYILTWMCGGSGFAFGSFLVSSIFKRDHNYIINVFDMYISDIVFVTRVHIVITLLLGLCTYSIKQLKKKYSNSEKLLKLLDNIRESSRFIGGMFGWSFIFALVIFGLYIFFTGNDPTFELYSIIFLFTNSCIVFILYHED